MTVGFPRRDPKPAGAIHVNAGSTSFVGEDGVQLFRALAVRGALKLWQKGIKANRNTTAKSLLASAGQITGGVYGQRAVAVAIGDLDRWIEAAKLAIPVTRA